MWHLCCHVNTPKNRSFWSRCVEIGIHNCGLNGLTIPNMQFFEIVRMLIGSGVFLLTATGSDFSVPLVVLNTSVNNAHMALDASSHNCVEYTWSTFCLLGLLCADSTTVVRAKAPT